MQQRHMLVYFRKMLFRVVMWSFVMTAYTIGMNGSEKPLDIVVLGLGGRAQGLFLERLKLRDVVHKSICGFSPSTKRAIVAPNQDQRS